MHSDHPSVYHLHARRALRMQQYLRREQAVQVFPSDQIIVNIPRTLDEEIKSYFDFN